MCADGTFMTSSYEEGGECARLSYGRFVKSDGEVDDQAMMQTSGPDVLAGSGGEDGGSNAKVSGGSAEAPVT